MATMQNAINELQYVVYDAYNKCYWWPAKTGLWIELSKGDLIMRMKMRGFSGWDEIAQELCRIQETQCRRGRWKRGCAPWDHEVEHPYKKTE